ncbi:MAG: YkgJ family cysteine cluster protein [Acidobacteriota bacterium]
MGALSLVTADPWYKDGLRFVCGRCGNCCRGGAGTVRVTAAEISALARRLGLDSATFRRRYTRRLRDGAISLRLKRNGDCAFYDRKRGCTVYAQRPRQCRTWPFWRSVVHSQERWEKAARRCPGMGTGRLYPRRFIEETIRNDGTSGRM